MGRAGGEMRGEIAGGGGGGDEAVVARSGEEGTEGRGEDGRV